jgi:hypothetical protein
MAARDKTTIRLSVNGTRTLLSRSSEQKNSTLGSNHPTFTPAIDVRPIPANIEAMRNDKVQRWQEEEEGAEELRPI